MTDRAAQSFSLRAIFSSSALVFSASLLLSVGGFLFHAVASRKLGVDDYGALYALITMSTLAVLPFSILTPVVARYAAEFRALHDDAHVRGLIELIVKVFVVVGVAYGAIALSLAGPIGAFVYVPSWEIPIVGIISAFALLSGMLRGISQGIHDYVSYAASMAAEGVGKVAIIAIAGVLGLTIFRGAGAFLSGSAIGACVIAFPLLARYRKTPVAAIVLDWRRILATTVAAASITLAMTVMGMGDVLIVKHYFSATDAGLYSAASLAAKILLYFVGFVPAILIPQATHRHARGEGTRKTLWLSTAFVCVVAFVGLAAYRFAGGLLLHALVGTAFDAALPLLTGYAAAMALLAVSNTLGAYALATHRHAFVVPFFLATCASLALIAVVHPSLSVVVNELVMGNAAMLACLAIPLAIQGARGTHA